MISRSVSVSTFGPFCSPETSTRIKGNNLSQNTDDEETWPFASLSVEDTNFNIFTESFTDEISPFPSPLMKKKKNKSEAKKNQTGNRPETLKNSESIVMLKRNLCSAIESDQFSTPQCETRLVTYQFNFLLLFTKNSRLYSNI